VANEPLRLDRKMRSRADGGVCRHLDRHRQQCFAVVTEIGQLAEIESLRRRPGDVAGGVARGQRPGQLGRQAGIAGVDPVRVSLRRMFEAQAEPCRLPGHECVACGDEFDFEMLVRDRRRVCDGHGKERSKRSGENSHDGQDDRQNRERLAHASIADVSLT